MRHVLLISAIFALTSCVTSTVSMIQGPDGTPHVLIKCGLVEHCYQKAADLCGKYKVVNTSTLTSGSEGNTSSQIQLLVKCE